MAFARSGAPLHVVPSTSAARSCEIHSSMPGANRYGRILAFAGIAIALVALPGAAYLFASSSQAPARRVPFTNQGTGLDAGDVQGAIAELATRLKAVESSQASAQSAVTTQKNELSGLQTSTQDQAIRIAGQEARVSTLEAKVAESIPVRRRIDYADEASAESVAPNYGRLRELGAFTKQHAATSVFLVWNTHVEAAGEPGSFCDFQLRIDGKPDTEWEGGGGRAVVYVPAGSGTTSAVSVSALFARVGAGSHAVGVWVRGSARACRENPGNFPRSVLVEETPRG